MKLKIFFDLEQFVINYEENIKQNSVRNKKIANCRSKKAK